MLQLSSNDIVKTYPQHRPYLSIIISNRSSSSSSSISSCMCIKGVSISISIISTAVSDYNTSRRNDCGDNLWRLLVVLLGWLNFILKKNHKTPIVAFN